MLYIQVSTFSENQSGRSKSSGLGQAPTTVVFKPIQVWKNLKYFTLFCSWRGKLAATLHLLEHWINCTKVEKGRKINKKDKME